MHVGVFYIPVLSVQHFSIVFLFSNAKPIMHPKPINANAHGTIATTQMLKVLQSFYTATAESFINVLMEIQTP